MLLEDLGMKVQKANKVIGVMQVSRNGVRLDCLALLENKALLDLEDQGVHLGLLDYLVCQ